MAHRPIVAAGAAVVLLVAGFLGLHVAQVRHNRLDLTPQKAAPEGEPFRPGEIFALTLAAVVEHELEAPFGWRPNDFLLWGPRLLADNNANRQLGIIRAVRETARVFKDHLTKVSSDEYDPDLLEADTLLRNDATKLWFPSAEGRFRQAVRKLRAYATGLRADSPRNRPIAVRNVELIRLFQAWTDLLGDAHANLYRSAAPGGGSVWFSTDDYFYRAQGYAHVMHHMMGALRREYDSLLKERPSLETLFEETTSALGEAAVIKPLFVLNGGPGGVLANHRRNLDGYVTESRQKMYSIREEIEK